MKSIIAVILHHNSPNSIIEVLRGIRAQTYPLKKIVLIDNGSNTNSRSILEQHIDDAIDVIWVDSNEGVGAGHNQGWQYALEKYKPDFIWSLEHDTIPEKNCLEILIKDFEKEKGKTKVMAACPVEIDGLNYNQYKYYILSSTGFGRLDDKKKLDNYFGGLTFNGLLIPKSTILDIGYLREDFFVGREDIDYCLRIWKQKGKILRVTKARIGHNLQKDKASFKIGNWIFMLPAQSALRDYYSFRNAIYMNKDSRSQLRLMLTLIRGLMWAVIFRKKKLSAMKLKFIAYRDGIRGNLGKRNYSFLKAP